MDSNNVNRNQKKKNPYIKSGKKLVPRQLPNWPFLSPPLTPESPFLVALTPRFLVVPSLSFVPHVTSTFIWSFLDHFFFSTRMSTT